MSVKLRNMASLYLRHEDKILLLYRVGSKVVGNSYVGSAGGHFEKDELNAPEACVLRELEEETGLTAEDVENLRMRYITMRLKNGEVRQNYYFFADLIGSPGEVRSCEGQLQWFDLADLADLEMPISAKHMLQHYVSVGRFTDKLYGGITKEDGTEFAELEEF